VAGRARKHADVVVEARGFRRDKVRDAVVRLVAAVLLGLLAQAVELGAHRRAARGVVARVDLDVVAVGAGREDADDAVEPHARARDKVGEHRLRLVEELLGLCADRGVVEDLGVAAVRVAAAQLPHLEEGVPVDVVDDVRDGERLEHLDAEQARLARRVGRVGPVDGKLLGLRLREREVPVLFCFVGGGCN
jgi:hypothetical protein